MSPQDFLASFHEIANAPGSVVRLRELILELAVQGRLLPQSSGEESASNSLERIRSAKADIAPSGRRKKSSSIETSYDQERPLPQGWSYCALADLVTVLNGRAYAKEELLDRGTPVLRVGNLFTSNHWYYSNLELEEDKYCDAGDLIFAWSASFGPFIWQGPKVIYHYHIWKLKPHLLPEQHISFLYWFLQNKTQEIKNAGHGVSMVHMTKEKMEQLTVALPPLVEQKRIVAKVEELMALCDALEAQQQERDSLFPRLSRATHTRLTDSPSQPHLDSIFTDLDSISPEDMRRSIHSLAVLGKLAPQDPAEPALDWRHNYNRPSEEVVSHTEQFIPDLPANWTWVRFEWLGEIFGGLTPSMAKSEFWHGDIPWVSPKDMHTKTLRSTEMHVTARALEQTSLKLVPRGSLLFVTRSGILRRTLPVALTEVECVINQDLKVLVPHDSKITAYIQLLLRGFETLILTELVKTGTTVQSVIFDAFRKKAFPFPPLAEQRRIVAMVDELIALVDSLEAQQQEKSRLAKSFAQACVASITGTRTETEQKMKAPVTELISLIRARETPPAGVPAPLATLIAKTGGEMQAKALWQQSELEIDAFYQQLKTELAAGWIAPQPAEVRVIDDKVSTTGNDRDVVVITKKSKRRLG